MEEIELVEEQAKREVSRQLPRKAVPPEQWRTARCGHFVFASSTVGGFFATTDPEWLRWVLVIGSLTGLMVIGFARIREEEEPKEEDVVEIARRAIQGEASRLDNKRADLEKVLMA